LWGEYGKISEISGVPFRKHAVRNIIGGFIVGYSSLEISGMGYVKMLKRLHGKKAKADLNISGGIANLSGKNTQQISKP
jgi:hypothetical protein